MAMPARTALLFGVAGLALGAQARPDFPEIEPNETKAQAQANPVFILAHGEAVTGNSAGGTTTPGPASADTFLIRTAPLPPGIYQNRLTLTTAGAAGHTGSIRGLDQIAAAAGVWPGPVGSAGSVDAVAQTSVTSPARFNQWYGFGGQEPVYYRVTGTAATTSDYAARLEVTPVTPTVIGPFTGSTLRISTAGQGHTTDTDLWLYDSAFNAIAGAGNDDNSTNGGGPGAGLQSFLRRDLAPGTYYLALTGYNLATASGSPCDDNFRTGILLDFPGAVLSSATSTNANTAFAITDDNGTLPVAATRAGAFDILWYKFTLTPGITGACCLLDQTCVESSRGVCIARNGIYRGDGSTCTTCPAITKTAIALDYNFNGMVQDASEQGPGNMGNLATGYRSVADRGLHLTGTGNALNAGPIVDADGMPFTIETLPGYRCRPVVGGMPAAGRCHARR